MIMFTFLPPLGAAPSDRPDMSQSIDNTRSSVFIPGFMQKNRQRRFRRPINATDPYPKPEAANNPRLSRVLAGGQRHVHLGKGQTEAIVALPKGTHTLQIVLGDFSHVPHNPTVVSDRITITVQ